MPLRKRISLVAAAAVAVAVALAVAVSYMVVRTRLLDQVDGQLTTQATDIQHGYGLGHPIPGLSASNGGPAPYVQLVLASGTILASQGGTLPGTSQAAAVAAGTTGAFMTDVTVHGTHVREFVFPLHAVADGQAVAVQLARPLGPVDSVLSDLRLILLLLFLGGIAVAAALGRIAARRVLAPLADVTHTAQVIGETDDLSLRMAIHSDDEVGQLAMRFNEMLERLETSRDALDDSVRSQRQLVADASHELRTPITSLRTNIEVLLAGATLDDEDRRRLLADVVEQSEELTQLVSDLIEMARGDLLAEAVEETRLDRVVEESLTRAHRNSPEVTFIPALKPVLVRANPARLSRAVNNLLDNAARHTSPGGPVEVTVDRDGLRVRDHGPGIDPEDLPYVFDRFYRGANSRASQGSGLGLAIVRQVAESYGGSIEATNAPDGGAVFVLSLPTVPEHDDARGPDEDLYAAGGRVARA